MTLSSFAGDLEMATPQDFSDTLRFITCGSVDDGKSTLIGRLLYESQHIFEDQLAVLSADSRKHGTQGERLDLALLVDGLQAEREQGITIDVAYRYFSTRRRHFVVADCPGHEQYTRNMATGASTAQVAVLLVDARKGLLTQTFRHSRIVSLMGVRRVVLAINKMDLVDYGQDKFRCIEAEFRAATTDLAFDEIVAIPLSALEGDNVTTHSTRMPWYEGPTLLTYLETIKIPNLMADQPFRLPIQMVSRPNQDFRGYAGQVASGVLQVGDNIRLLPSGMTTRVSRIITLEGDLESARAGDAVMLTLEDERDISRGDVLVAADADFQVADQFEAHVVWFNENPLVPGRAYVARLHTKSVSASVSQLKWVLDVNTGAMLAGKTVAMNEIANVTLSFDQPVAFEPYRDCPSLGGFILIDRITNETVGAGMIKFSLKRSQNIRWQELSVDRVARAAIKHQTPVCIWMTGLSGAGKSTIASLLEQCLHLEGRHTYILDGDNVRHGLNRDLGFTAADRVENIRRLAEVAKLMVDAGLIVIASSISPFRAEREWARSLFEPGQFVEIFVNASLEVCIRRDIKGLYAQSQRGSLANLTGIDSPYERPENPEIILDTEHTSPEDCVRQILACLKSNT